MNHKRARLAAKRVPVDVSAPPIRLVRTSVWQQRVLRRREVEGDDAADILTEIYSVRGDFDVSAFAAAMDRIVFRHQVLQTAYTDVAVGRVTESLAGVRVVDLSHDHAAAERWIHAQFDRTFPPSAPPLLRTTIAVCEPASHLIAFSAHEVAFDGWSFGVLLSELCALYPACHQNPGPPFEQFFDVVARAPGPDPQAIADAAAPLRGFRLEGWPVGASSRESVGPAARRSIVFDGIELTRMSAVCRSATATDFAAVLVAVRVSLAAVLGVRDTVVTCPIAGRQPATEALIGPFSNLVPLRGDVPPSARLMDLLRREQAQVFAAIGLQDAPIGAVLAEAGCGEGVLRVHVAVEPSEQPFAMPGVELGYVTTTARRLRPDIAVVASIDFSRIELFVDVRTDTLGSETGRCLAQSIVSVMEMIGSNPDARVGDVRNPRAAS